MAARTVRRVETPEPEQCSLQPVDRHCEVSKDIIGSWVAGVEDLGEGGVLAVRGEVHVEVEGRLAGDVLP